MIQSPKLKAQTPTWNEKARYRVGNVVIYNGNYWSNINGYNKNPEDSGWLLMGSVLPVVGGINNNRNKYILVEIDADDIQDNDFIGATEVFMIISSVAGPIMKSNIIFNSTTGTIEDFPVVTGDEFTIFFTKP